MTREEAIKIIYCYDLNFYDLNGEKIPANKLVEAFDMAIEALSVVHCKDCRWYDNRYGDVCHNPRYGDGWANYPPPYVDKDYWCKDGKGGDDE